MKKNVFILFVTLLTCVFLFCGCGMNSRSALLKYAEKKYNKQFDVLEEHIEPAFEIWGYPVSYLVLTNKDDNFCFRVVYTQKEVSDDYMSVYYGTFLTNTAAETLFNKQLDIADISYHGYLLSDHISDYMTEETPQFNKKDRLYAVIAFECPEIFTDKDFQDAVQTVYDSLHKNGTEFMLQVIGVKADDFSVIADKITKLSGGSDFLEPGDFDGMLKYNFWYSFDSATPLTVEVLQKSIKKF